MKDAVKGTIFYSGYNVMPVTNLNNMGRNKDIAE